MKIYQLFDSYLKREEKLEAVELADLLSFLVSFVFVFFL